MSIVGRGLYSGLVEWGEDGRPKPELAASFEAKTGARDWIFNLRKGVKFSNGREFNADDAIYSLNLARGDSKSAGRPALSGVLDIKKLDVRQIQVTLISADADFPAGLTDVRILMVPDGFTDWANPVGTGAFRLGQFDPGVRIALTRNPDFWKEGRGHLDGAEILVINDSAARFEALKSGQIDVVNRVSPKTAAALEKTPGLKLVRATSGYHVVAAMQVDAPPFDNLSLRLALKYAVDRDAVLKALFGGYGALGNDHPIPPTDPYFNSELAQRRRDPDRAAFLLRKSGLSNPSVVLQACDLVFNDALDAAQSMRASWSAAGFAAEIKREPAEGYWDKVWLRGPFVASYWRGRPAATEMLATAYAARAPANETHWNNSKFETLLANARAETDEAKRKPFIWEMQKLICDDGGAIIPAFRDWLDAHHEKVGGHTPTGGAELDNGYILEKAWIRG